MDNGVFRRHDTGIRAAAASLGVMLPVSRRSIENAALLQIDIQSCLLPTEDNLFDAKPAALKVVLVQLHGQYPQLRRRCPDRVSCSGRSGHTPHRTTQ